MTTASELKRAAVVEVENKAREETVKQAVKQMHNATELEERCSRHDDTGFRFSTTISSVFRATFSFAGSTTAAANSRLFSTQLFSTQDVPTQQNPVPHWRNLPERAFHASCAD